MDKRDKFLRYSMQVSYLGILLREELLSEEEYEKCLGALRKDYGIVSDILADK
ncbi:MAG: conjugal transfer protein [Butyrivibrio sp.]|nr:conjugal transfer protein [Butyrivibrio sp.]